MGSNRLSVAAFLACGLASIAIGAGAQTAAVTTFLVVDRTRVRGPDLARDFEAVGMKHRKLAVGCPTALGDFDLKLNEVVADAESLNCVYVAGRGLSAEADAAMRYQLSVAPSGLTPAMAAQRVSEQMQQQNRMRRVVPAPLPIGAPPAAQAALFWETADGRIVGSWTAGKGRILAVLRVDIPLGAEAEARAMAEILMRAFHEQTAS